MNGPGGVTVDAYLAGKFRGDAGVASAMVVQVTLGRVPTTEIPSVSNILRSAPSSNYSDAT